MTPIKRAGAIAIVLSLSVLAAGGEVFQGKVTGVESDMTLSIEWGGAAHKVHLRGIHFCKEGEALRDRATELLRKSAVGKDVRVEVVRQCGEGHPVAVVSLPGKWTVQSLLLEAGLAWRCKEDIVPGFEQAEGEAKAKRLGVWRGDGVGALDTEHSHGKPSSWNDQMYAKYDFRAFRDFAQAKEVIDRNAVDHELLSAAVFYATNAIRQQNGKPLFGYSRALRDCAFEHSRDMATQGFFNHNNPHDKARRTPFDRMVLKGVREGTRGENIASRGAQNETYLQYAERVLTMWMGSPGHRQNILNAQFKFLGCGGHPCRCPRFHLLATQNFGEIVPDGIRYAASR